MLKHFLLGAIRRVFRPGSKYEEMLCLVGGQGAGKSSFFRLLAIRDEWFSDDLKKLDDDRVYLKLQGHWIIEMSEMLATSSARALRKSVRLSADRRKPTGRLTNLSLKTGFGSALCSAVPRIHWTFCPLDRAGNRRFPCHHDLPGECGGSHFGGRGRLQSLPVTGLGGGHEDLPQRKLLYEVQQVHPAATGGGAERLHAGGHRSRADTGISGTLHRKHGLLQTAVQGGAGTYLRRAEAVAASQYQRDHEHGRDRLETFLQSEDVHRIRQAEGLGTGHFRQRTARQRRWICGADRGRMLPVGAAEGVDRIK